MEEDFKQKRIDASMAKRRAQKELEEALESFDLQTDSEWSFLEHLAHDVEAIFTAQNIKPSAQKVLEEMKTFAEDKYQEYDGLPKIIAAALPSYQRIQQWRKKKSWQTAVWDKCREDGHFTPARKSSILEALYNKVIEKGDVAAAKLLLTISGDYSEKIDVNKNQAVADIFREINEKLHGK